jgi:hypothetical protein
MGKYFVVLLSAFSYIPIFSIHVFILDHWYLVDQVIITVCVLKRYSFTTGCQF